MASIIQFALNLASNIGPVLAQASTAIRNFIGTTNGAQKSVSGLGSSILKIGGLIGGAFAIGKIISFGKEIIQAGADMEVTRKKFEVFTGSVEAGNAQIARISKLAIKTPFEKKELLDVGAALEVAGVHGEDTIGVMTKLGNIFSATASKGTTFRQFINEIYTKNRGDGVLHSKDLNQFAAYNLNVVDFAKSLSKTRSELYDMAKAGEVTFPMLDKWLTSLGGAGGKFGGLMDKMSGTVAGQWSNLKDSIAQMMSDFGESKVPLFANVLKGANQVLQWITKNKFKISQLFVPFQQGAKMAADLVLKIGKAFGFTGEVNHDLGVMVERWQSISNEVGVLFTNVVENVGVVIDAFKELWGTFDKISQQADNKSFGQELISVAREIGAEFMEAANFIGNATRMITHAAEVGRQFATNSPTKWGAIYRADAEWSTNEAKRWAEQDKKAMAFRNGPKQAGDGGGGFYGPDNEGSWGDPISKAGKKMAQASAAGKDDSKKIMGDVTGTRPTNVYLTVNKLVAQEIATQAITNIKDFKLADFQNSLIQATLGALNDTTRLAGAQQ